MPREDDAQGVDHLLRGHLLRRAGEVEKHRVLAARLGQELDLQLLYTCKQGVALGLKGALYDADQFSVDTDKWMAWAAYKF